MLRELESERTRDLIFSYPNNLGRDFQRACDLAYIGHCRIHDLCHTSASGLVRHGIPLNTMRELLGHATMTMTLRYAHLAPDSTQAAVAVLYFGPAVEAEVVDIAEDVG